MSYFAAGGKDGAAIFRPNAPAGDSSGASAVSFAGPTCDSGNLRRESRRLSLTGAPPERPPPEGGPQLERRVQHGCGPRRRSDGACPQQGLRAAPAHRKVCCFSTSLSLLFFVSFVLMDSIELYRCWSFGGRGLSSDYLRLPISRFEAHFFSVFQELQMFFFFFWCWFQLSNISS